MRDVKKVPVIPRDRSVQPRANFLRAQFRRNEQREMIFVNKHRTNEAGDVICMMTTITQTTGIQMTRAVTLCHLEERETTVPGYLHAPFTGALPPPPHEMREPQVSPHPGHQATYLSAALSSYRLLPDLLGELPHITPTGQTYPLPNLRIPGSFDYQQPRDCLERCAGAAEETSKPSSVTRQAVVRDLGHYLWR